MKNTKTENVIISQIATNNVEFHIFCRRRHRHRRHRRNRRGRRRNAKTPKRRFSENIILTKFDKMRPMCLPTFQALQRMVYSTFQAIVFSLKVCDWVASNKNV